MKRTKVYRPRRGIRFSDDVGTKRPAGGFIGAQPLSRPHETVPKPLTPPADVETVDVGADVMRSAGRLSQAQALLTAPFPPVPTALLSPVVVTSSLIIRDSVSKGHRWEREAYRQSLLGIGPAGLTPGSSLDSSAITGSAIPSWTNAKLGTNRNSAYVNVALSSSDHEVLVLNLWRSGSEAMESSAVPVTRSLYYSKESRLNTITVKLTSSQSTGLVDDANFGTLIAATASIDAPLRFNFSVPVRGYLSDIKVWVEIVMLSGNVAFGSTGSAGHLVWAALTGTYLPLESVGISLRSPNQSWPGHWAHPMKNDPIYRTQVAPGTSSFIAGGNFGFAREPNEFYRDSYLLWEPASFFDSQISKQPGWEDGSSTAALGGMRRNCPTWGRDIGMRTVFYDGSPYQNPRVFRKGIVPDLNANGAPNVFGQWPSSDTTISGTTGGWQFGNNVPWTTDSGSWGGNAASTLTSYGSLVGSPPVGWLTGPGGSAAVNEWPTTGSNIGAPSICPVYPLLDTIYQVLDGDPPSKWTAGLHVPGDIDFPYPDYARWKGVRPGLRGTEISGTWTLMFARPPSGSFSGGSSVVPWAFVRQARLEITYSTGRGSVRKSLGPLNPTKGGARFWGTITGSDEWDWNDTGPSHQGAFVHGTYTFEQESSGKLFGIFMGTGSAPSDVALEWRLSGGVLAEASGTGPGWLTNNQFGMPAIPLSSWSLGFPISPVEVSASTNLLSSIFPGKVLDGPQKLAVVAESVNPAKTLGQIAQSLSTASL